MIPHNERHPRRYVVDYQWHCVAGFRHIDRRRLLTGRNGRTVVFHNLDDAEIAASRLLNARIHAIDEHGRRILDSTTNDTVTDNTDREVLSARN